MPAMTVTLRVASNPEENQSPWLSQVIGLPASCSIPLFRNGNDNFRRRFAGLANSNSPPTVKRENREENTKQVSSIHIPVFQLNAMEVQTPSNNVFDIPTGHFLTAWAALLAYYVDIEHPYFGYTAVTAAGDEHLLCHARVRKSESAEDILASVTVDSLHRNPHDQGADPPIFNTRYIDSTRDLGEHEWEKVNRIAL